MIPSVTQQQQELNFAILKYLNANPSFLPVASLLRQHLDAQLLSCQSHAPPVVESSQDPVGLSFRRALPKVVDPFSPHLYLQQTTQAESTNESFVREQQFSETQNVHFSPSILRPSEHEYDRPSIDSSYAQILHPNRDPSSATTLPLRYDWKGRTHPMSAEEAEMQYPRVSGDHLLRALRPGAPSRGYESLLTVPGLSREVSQDDESVNYLDARCLGFGHHRYNNIVQNLKARELGIKTFTDNRPPSVYYKAFREHVVCVGHRLPAFCCQFDRTGARFITGGDDLLVKVWNTRSGYLIHSLRAHKDVICDLDVDPSNTLLATASNDGVVCVWDLQSGDVLAVLGGHHVSEKPGITACFFSPAPLEDMRYLLTSGQDGLVRLWQYSREYPHIKAHPYVIPCKTLSADEVESTAFNATGSRFAIGSTDGYIRIFSTVKPDVSANEIRSKCDKLSYVTRYESDGTLDLESRPRNPTRITRRINSLNSNTATEGRDPSRSTWPVPHMVARLEGHLGPVQSLIWSHAGDRLLSGSTDGLAMIWSFNFLEAKWDQKSLDLHVAGPSVVPSKVSEVAWSCDDSKCAVTNVAGDMFIFVSKTGRKLYRLQASTDRVLVLRFHPQDPRTILTAGYDGGVALWDLDRGDITKSWEYRESYGFTDGRWNPDGTKFVLTSQSGAAYLFGTGLNGEYEEARTFRQQSFAMEHIFPGWEYTLFDATLADRVAVVRHGLVKSLLQDFDGRPLQERRPPDHGLNLACGMSAATSCKEAMTWIETLVAELPHLALEGVQPSVPEFSGDRAALVRFERQRRRDHVRDPDASSTILPNSVVDPREDAVEFEEPIYPISIDDDEQDEDYQEADTYAEADEEVDKTGSSSSSSDSAESSSAKPRFPSKRKTRSSHARRRSASPLIGSSDEEFVPAAKRIRGRFGRRAKQVVSESGSEEEKEEAEAAAAMGSGSENEFERDKESVSDEESSFLDDEPGPSTRNTGRRMGNGLPSRSAHAPYFKKTETRSPSTDSRPSRDADAVHVDRELFAPSDWVKMTSPQVSPYHPQVGDRVAYMREGHSEFLEMTTFGLSQEEFIPWVKRPDWPHTVYAIVEAVDFRIGPPTYAVVTLRHMTEFERSTLEFVVPIAPRFPIHAGSRPPAKTFKVLFRDAENVPDYIVLLSQAAAGLNRRFVKDEKVEAMYGDQWYPGTISCIGNRPPRGESPSWQKNSPWQCYTVKWDDENALSEKFSPWELRLPGDETAIGGQSLTEDETSRIASVLQHLVSDPEYALFGDHVDLATYPDYVLIVPYPMCLEMIRERLAKGWYRDARAVASDVGLIAKNARSFNESGTVVPRTARRLEARYRHLTKDRSIPLPVEGDEEGDDEEGTESETTNGEDASFSPPDNSSGEGREMGRNPRPVIRLRLSGAPSA